MQFKTQCGWWPVACSAEPGAPSFLAPRPWGLIKVFLYLLVWVLWMEGFGLLASTVPPGFAESVVAGPSEGGWNEAVGLTFESNGRMYVWERAGRVWFKDSGDPAFSLLVDIHEEVAAMFDHGLLGFALDPNFRQNGYIYLLYVVDRHHLLYFGTPNYDPNANLYNDATIGRVTRYTCRQSDGLRSVDSASRLILIGETKETGLPVLSESHGVGSLVFGQDGTLLVSCGDSASPTTIDLGGPATGSWAPRGRTDGIISLKEDIGAFRSQLVDCHNGKVLRIDPATGNGVPSNPFYDSANPRSPRSRVWALGLRNPCRMSLRPESGSHDPADGNPGVLYIGDAGWNNWEEMDVVMGPGLNFGWPLYEGLTLNTSYNENVLNRDAVNPLYPASGCSQFFTFKQLLNEDTLDPAGLPPFPNPCDTSQKIPTTIPQFLHHRPVLDWNHNTQRTRTPIYGTSGQAQTANVGAPDSPVSGTQFRGNCSIGGDWYTGTAFPVQYRNTCFQADFGASWIKSVEFDLNNNPVVVRDFLSNGGAIVKVVQNPFDGTLYYISWTTTIRKIAYTGNRTPDAAASADVYFGPSPMDAQFSSAGSSDPDGQPITYSWDFGDGSPVNNQANPSHTFSAPAGVPTKFIVTLTVSDNLGLTAQTNLIVSVNNTPPNVTINSPVDGSRFPPGSGGYYNLLATVTDAESSDAALSYEWQTILYHNEHKHNSPPDTNHVTLTVISPTGCDGINIYNYGIVLTVTDAAGLSTRREVKLYPDCGTNTSPMISDLANQSTRQDRVIGPIGFTVGDWETSAANLLLGGNSSNPTLIPSGNIVFGGSGSNRTVTLTPVVGQTGTATITVTVSDGPLNASDTFDLTVNPSLSGTASFTNTYAIAIVDRNAGSPYPALIGVMELGGTISNVTVKLNNIHHTYPDDLDILLVSPTGQQVLLMSDAGGSLDLNNVTLTFSDAAAAALSDNGQLATGTFKPTNYDTNTDSFAAPAPAAPYTTNLSVFNGQGASGAWALYVMDDGSGDQGTIAGGWSLTITTIGVGAAPTISDMTNRSTTANTATPAIAFTVADADTLVGDLTVSGKSSNLALVPASNMVFGGSGSDRSVTVTPAAEQIGTATITVTVSDGTSTASDEFVLTVHAANMPPVLTVPLDATIDELTLYASIATATNAGTPTNALTFALVSGPDNLTVSAGGAITWTPREDQGPSTNLVTIRVTDDGSPALGSTNSYTLIVAEVNEAPTLAPVSDRFLNAGQTLLITNSASDADIPQQVLTFSLLSFPSGATLDATSGIFNWRPTDAQVDAKYQIELEVTDSGSPPLGATQSFTVIVTKFARPSVVEISMTNNQIVLLIAGEPGFDYIVQASTDLTIWTDLSITNSPTLPFTCTVSNANDFRQRFFRVLLKPERQFNP